MEIEAPPIHPPTTPPPCDPSPESLALIDFADESIEIVRCTSSPYQIENDAIIQTKSGRRYDSKSKLHLDAKETLGDSYCFPLFFYNEHRSHDKGITLVVWKNRSSAHGEHTTFYLSCKEIIDLRPFVEGYYILTYADTDRSCDIAVNDYIAQEILKKQKALNLDINNLKTKFEHRLKKLNKQSIKLDFLFYPLKNLSQF